MSFLTTGIGEICTPYKCLPIATLGSIPLKYNFFYFQNQQLTDVMKENHKLKKINAKLINICKKRGKSHESNRENEEPADKN